GARVDHASESDVRLVRVGAVQTRLQAVRGREAQGKARCARGVGRALTPRGSKLRAVTKRNNYHSGMGKLILDIKITSPDDKSATVKAVFDSGSFYSILREDKVPKGAV